MRVLISSAPATGEPLGEVPVTSPTEILVMVERAHRAQRAWASLSIDERIERVSEFVRNIHTRGEEIAALVSAECGKPRHEALVHEVVTTCELGAFYMREAKRVFEPRTFSPRLLKHRTSHVRSIPYGIVGILSPWNFPFVIPTGDLIAALLAGNAVMLKPSEWSPLTARLTKEIFDGSGLPEDLFQVVYGAREQGEALVGSGIQKVIFTGGTEGGRHIASLAGKHLIPCVLELGGKAPAIVCEDANLALASKAIVYGAFANLGQACVSVERVYAVASIYDRFVQRVADETRGLTQGDPAKGSFDLGALRGAAGANRVKAQVSDALSKGARLLVSKDGLSDTFVFPSVLIHCDHTMAVMTEESFGPILGIQRVEDEEEALRLANSLPAALSANVFSSDKKRARSLAERLRAGSVAVNDVLVNYGTAEAPFGGLGASGYGRVHGEASLLTMTQAQHISEERVPLGSRNPLWFPYSEWKTSLARKTFRLLFAKR